VSSSIETAQVGNTSMRVSRLGVGSAPIGNLRQPVPEAQAVEMIQHSLEQGMNFFDTAPLYGSGIAERFLGQALKGIPRDQYVIQTKVGRLVREDGSIYFDFSRDGVLRSLEESLQRLGLDSVDCLLVHDPDAASVEDGYRQALDEAFPTLADLRSQGVIKALGAGMNQWEMEWDFARNFDVNCFLLAGRYTLLEQTSLDFLQYCQEHNIGIFLGGVYNSGILATGPRQGAQYQYADAPPHVLEKAQQLENVCRRHNVPLRIAAMHFARAHPAVTALIIGSISRAEAQDNRDAWNAHVPDALWHDLREEGLVEAGAPLPV
jgi:D-threo-aldose 1-dehydrogenase